MLAQIDTLLAVIFKEVRLPFGVIPDKAGCSRLTVIVKVDTIALDNGRKPRKPPARVRFPTRDDIIEGDQTLFMRRDSVEAAWQLVDPILYAWEESPNEVPLYAAGSWGPLESALLMAANGRAWRVL